MVYQPDALTAAAEQKLRRRGYVVAGTVTAGLALLFLLFRPSGSLTLPLSLALLALGAWTAYREAQSGRLDLTAPPSSKSLPTFRRQLPAAALLGAVIGALLAGQWVMAIANVLFFFAGAGLGIGAFVVRNPRTG